MLSRCAISKAFSNQAPKTLVALVSRPTSTSSAQNQVATTNENQITFSRPVRLIEPGKVRMGFIPEEWFQFFHKKTGVTGPYVFGFTLSTYLISKEVYVLEHEFYNGLSLMLIWIFLVKKFGPKVAVYLDKEIDVYQQSLQETRDVDKRFYEDQIAQETKAQWSQEGQILLSQAKRENVALQLEASYRERLMQVYNAVKKRLDYQIETQNVERRVAQKNLVDFVVARVRASITADQEKQNINKCIADLQLLAKA